MSEQERATHFKAEVHKLIEDSNEARFQVSKMFNNERVRLLEEAKQNGSEKPLEDVIALRNSMYNAVQDKLHGDFHKLCLDYGYSKDHQQVQFFAEQEELGLQPRQETQAQDEDSAQAPDIETDMEPPAYQPDQDDDQEQ